MNAVVAKQIPKSPRNSHRSHPRPQVPPAATHNSPNAISPAHQVQSIALSIDREAAEGSADPWERRHLACA